MSFGVQSYAELYTTLIGWQMYDQIWHVLVETGLAYIPFIGLVLKNTIQPYESQEAKSTADTSIKRMHLDLIITIFMVLIGGSPFINLDPSLVSYTPTCQPDGQSNTYTPGNTGTTYDKAFGVPTGQIQVPIWWYGVMALSGGMTTAANTFVACVPDYRQMVTQVDMAQIKDPQVAQQLHQFETDCYLPARAQYLQETKENTNNYQQVQNNISQYGADDADWFGSHGFQATYYQNLRAAQPVPGFQYNQNEDINAGAYPDGTPTPAYATPTCAEWWSGNGSNNGLQAQLLATLPTDFFHKFSDVFSTQQKFQDDATKRIVTNNSASGYEATDNVADTGSFVSRMTEHVGVLFADMAAYPTIYAISQAAPIVQALLLLMCYAFLPFYLVFSGYKAESFTTGAVVIFSLVFFSFIWAFVGWVDSVLTHAFFNDDSWFAIHDSNEDVVNIIIGLMQLFAPLFWIGLMSVFGIKAGSVVSSVGGVMSAGVDKPASQIGGAGVSGVKTIATAGISAATKVIK